MPLWCRYFRLAKPLFWFQRHISVWPPLTHTSPNPPPPPAPKICQNTMYRSYRRRQRPWWRAGGRRRTGPPRERWISRTLLLRYTGGSAASSLSVDNSVVSVWFDSCPFCFCCGLVVVAFCLVFVLIACFFFVLVCFLCVDLISTQIQMRFRAQERDNYVAS